MIREELKKIWRPGMIGIFLLLGAIYYTMFMEFYIRYFPNGPQAEGIFQVSAGLVEKYGTSLSIGEMEEAKAEFSELYSEADGYIRGLALAQEHGLQSYEEYVNFQEKTYEDLNQFGNASDQSGNVSNQSDGLPDSNKDYRDLMLISNYLTGSETKNIGGRIYGAEWLLQFYEREQEIRELFLRGELETDYSVREQKRIQKLLCGEDALWQNILPAMVTETTSVYMYFMLIWMCLSVCLFIAPLQVNDRLSRMRTFQYSSKRGRKIFSMQFKTAMLSAFILTILNLVIFMGIFATNGTAVFRDCRVYSFAAAEFSWVDWKYGTWCLVLMIICCLIAMGTAAAAFFLAHHSANYISMLLKLIPVIAVLATVLPPTLYQAFYFYNGMYRMTKIPYVEAVFSVLIFAAGNVLCRGTYGKIKKCDIV